MELDDMKQAWEAMSRQLEKQNALTLQSFKDSRLDKARRLLRPLRWGQRLQIVTGIILMLLAATFWVEHLERLPLAVYGLLLHAYGLTLVVTAARNLHLQDRLDPSSPVVELQKRLAALRRWRLKEAVLYGITGCFIWIPLLLVLFELLGADVWNTAPSVVADLSLGGLACLAIFYGIIRVPRLRPALEGSSIGRGVRDTQAMLDEIERFERA